MPQWGGQDSRNGAIEMVDLSSLMKLAQNPEIKNVMNSLLHQFGGSGGKSSGGGQQMHGLVQDLNNNGLSDQVKSWVGTGKNQSITPEQVTQAVGQQHIEQVAHESGVSTDQVTAHLAKVLPQVIDSASPGGKTPSAGDFDQVLNSAFSGGSGTRNAARDIESDL